MPTTNENKNANTNKNRNTNPKDHRNYHPVDYRYLSEKGYTDDEVIAIWDRDVELGKGPCDHEGAKNHPAFEGIY